MRIFSAACLFLVLTLPLAAQETRGTFSGTITDSSGAAVAGSSVTVVNIDTNASLQSLTNSSGCYEAPLLLPGAYRMTVE